VSRQLWLADAARRWGLVVVEVDGWQSRGSADFAPAGTVAHHTAGPGAGGDIPSLPTLINGRPDLAGPLCNYGLGRSGTVYVVAAGRANHAGAGGWAGLSGNSSVVGIEAENDGFQPWPLVQEHAYGLLCAAVCEALGAPAGNVCRHHEWRAEKPDPHGVDGDTGRATVARLLAEGPNHGGDMPLNAHDLDLIAEVVRAQVLDIVRKEGISGAAAGVTGSPSNPSTRVADTVIAEIRKVPGWVKEPPGPTW
jgi:hypothetical protein